MVPSAFPLISTSVGESTSASAMAGSPTEKRWMGTGFTRSAEAPLETETTRSGWVRTRWAATGPACSPSSRTTEATIQRSPGQRPDAKPTRCEITSLP